MEIGSGTGQHAVYFGRKLNHLIWQTSDLEGNIAQINARLEFEGTDNIIAPLTLDVTQSNWPKINADAVFIANVFHICPWEVTEQTFKRIKNANLFDKLLKKNSNVLTIKRSSNLKEVFHLYQIM